MGELFLPVTAIRLLTFGRSGVIAGLEIKGLRVRAKLILFSLLSVGLLPASAQVLARPGWAGSGVAPEAWWRRAVFYRVDPARFQDSNETGRGDLQGIVQRLDYIQSVGVDALVLDGSLKPEGLDELVREASLHHLRVVVALDGATAQGSRDALLHTVHDWLSAGVAGIWAPGVSESGPVHGGYAAQMSALRQMLQGFPGDRVLLDDPAPVPLGPAPRPVRLGRVGEDAPSGTPRFCELVTSAVFPVASASVSQLRANLESGTRGASPELNPLLRFAGDPPTGSPNAAGYAAVLLASRGAALFDFGDEIGLDAYPGSGAALATRMASPMPVMQWTPSNRTPAPVERTDGAHRIVTPVQTEFGAYHPYQPPPRGLAGPSAPSAHVTVDANVPADLPAPDSLPGFTAGTLPGPPVDGSRINVITEDRDRRSLLNAYRQLIGLHHDNATLRNGTQYVANHDAEGALVWFRRAPAGSRTVANVVVAANLTDTPVVLALDGEIEELGMRAGALRPLFVYSKEPLTGETTEHLALPAHAVFLGEIFHAGPGPAARVHEVRFGRRSRHRVRR